MAKEFLKEFLFSEDDKREYVDVIVENAATLGAAAASRKYGVFGIIGSNNMPDSEYNESNKKVKESILAFSAQKAGIKTPKSRTELAYAFDNPVFRSVINTITTKTIALMMVRYENPQISAFTDIENVEVGESKTYEIDTKGLPIAQAATYGSNVSLVPSYAKGSVTVTPKPYTLGASLDYIRIVGNDYDWGAEIARVYAGLLFAQYKLAYNTLFNTSILSGTPFYRDTFSSATYVQLATDIGMLNGGSVSGVTAYGTRVAFNAISALATNGGYTTKDDYIKNGFLQKIYGIDSVILEQITSYSAPFTADSAATLRTIPDGLIVLLSTNTDKPVKLVRENYIRVIETESNDNTANRMEYTYFQNFDAKLATASHFGLQGTTGA